jgi:phosphoglycolate phosphatase-like HAD superfamily hydrolase
MDFPTGHDVVFAFDFDGVVCDSVRENVLTTWRAVCKRWPDRASGSPSQALLDTFVSCRPVIETGYQNIPLLNMLLAGTSTEDIHANFDTLVPKFMTAEGLTNPELEAMFGAARDEWLAESEDDWLAAQGFYPGVPEAVNLVAERAVIITTKQYRFAVELVKLAGINISADRVYGLEKLTNGKRGVLEDFLTANQGATAHFFEDRLATLNKMTDMPTLQRYLVDWGYNTPGERDAARDDKRIDVLDDAAFRSLLEGHAV